MNSQTSIQNFSDSIIGSNGLNFVNAQLKAGVASNNLDSFMRKSSKASNSDLLFQQTVFKSLQENSKRQEELESLIKSNFMSSKIKSESVEEPEKEEKKNGSLLLRNKIGKNLNSVLLDTVKSRWLDQGLLSPTGAILRYF